MDGRLAFAALALILIASAAEIDILQESLKDYHNSVEDQVNSFTDQTEDLVEAQKSDSIMTNNYVWKDSCGCKNEAEEPVCADGESFPNACSARCKGHEEFTSGICHLGSAPPPKKQIAKLTSGGLVKVVRKKKKGLSKACKAKLKRMKKWAKDEVLKAHLLAEEAKRHEAHAAHDKAKCDQHMSLPPAMRANFEGTSTLRKAERHHHNFCVLADKFKQLAKKAEAKGLEHAHQAELWHTRYTKKQCLKSQWTTHQLVGESNHQWGGSGKRISLIWSKNYEKAFRMRWPHCYNLQCFRAGIPRNVIEDACDKDDDCSGFSFTADKRFGVGCLKQCFHQEGFAGYGAITYDYWRKREIKHIQIFASTNGVMLYAGCFHNGEQTMSWRGKSHLVTAPNTFSKDMHGMGIDKADLSGASIPKGWCLSIYDKKDYKGHRYDVPGPKNIACFKNYRMHDKVSWDNKAMSIKVYRNKYGICSSKPPKKKLPVVLPKKKIVDYRQVPAEYSQWWKKRDQEMKVHYKRRLTDPKTKYKKRYHWKQAEVQHVLKKLEKLHHHETLCEMGDKGCREKEAARERAMKKKAAKEQAAHSVASSSSSGREHKHPKLRRIVEVSRDGVPQYTPSMLKKARRKPKKRENIPLSDDLSASAYIRKLKREEMLRSSENTLQAEADEALMGDHDSVVSEQTAKLKASDRSAVAPSSQVSFWVSALALLTTLLAQQ